MGDSHLMSSRYRIRPATQQDISVMTDVFFHSFNAPFWQYFVPDDAKHRAWWDEAWRIGIENPTDRSFVVEDTQRNNKVVAFSRWMVPQEDGNQERKWPDVKEDEWDMDVAGPFFGGMEANREELMGKRPHWMLEMLGVHEDYQGQGIAASLIKWGTDQADASGLETYLDGSEKGQPYYEKRHNFGSLQKGIELPDRPAYGSYKYKSLVRAPQQLAQA